MIRPLILATILSAAAVSATAQPDPAGRMTMAQYWSGPATTRVLAWSGGDEVTIGMPSQITYVQGPAVRFEVTGPKTAVDLLSVRNGVMRSNVQLTGRQRWSDDEHFTVRITAPNVERFNISIGSHLKAASITGARLRINASTGAEADVVARVRDLTVNANTGAEVKVRGKADSAEVHTNTGGEIDLTGLTLDRAEVHASTGARATLGPASAAEVHASTDARIRLLTKPAHLKTRTSLGARIN